MERWRSFFNKAGEDLWTIIEQAILLAAHDYPAEFKEKRCDIAETLFTSRPHQAHGDADVPRLSASVVTNCTNPRMDVDETRGEDEHLSAHTHTKEHMAHDAEQHNSELCSAEARDNRVDDDASISRVVCNIKETLAGSMQSDAALLHGLQTLESLHISVDVLKATEIGKQVNSLRKHSGKEIRLLAKGLVRHWKELVDDWVHRAGASLQEGHTASERDNDEGMLSPSHGNSAQIITRMRGEMPQHCYHDTKAGDNYLEAPEERGSSSRAEIPGLARIEKKPQFIGRDAASKEVSEYESNVGTSRLRGLKESHGTLGSGRPSSDIIAGNETELSRNYGTSKLSTEGSYLNKLQGDYSSQKHKQSRIPILNQQKSMCNEGVSLEEKLQVSKRKSQEVHMQVDHAKRQQMALPLNNLKDFPTTGGGVARAKTAMSGLAPLNSHWK